MLSDMIFPLTLKSVQWHNTMHIQDDESANIIAMSLINLSQTGSSVTNVIPRPREATIITWSNNNLLASKSCSFSGSFSLPSATFAQFHLATKIWGGSAINEWAYSACQVPWDVFLGEFLFGNNRVFQK